MPAWFAPLLQPPRPRDSAVPSGVGLVLVGRPRCIRLMRCMNGSTRIREVGRAPGPWPPPPSTWSAAFIHLAIAASASAAHCILLRCHMFNMRSNPLGFLGVRCGCSAGLSCCRQGTGMDDQRAQLGSRDVAIRTTRRPPGAGHFGHASSGGHRGRGWPGFSSKMGRSACCCPHASNSCRIAHVRGTRSSQGRSSSPNRGPMSVDYRLCYRPRMPRTPCSPR